MKDIQCLIIAIAALANVFAWELAAKPTREQIIECLEEANKVEWEAREKVNLVERFGSDFSGLDLSGIHFRVPYVRGIASGADFSHCNMQGITFDHMSLEDCNFSNADLTNAKFLFCSLDNADFSHVQLHQTQFAGTDMLNVLFTDLNVATCRFDGTDFSAAKLMNTDFSQATVIHGRFSRADLSGANLSNITLWYAKFQDATGCALGARFWRFDGKFRRGRLIFDRESRSMKPSEKGKQVSEQL